MNTPAKILTLLDKLFGFEGKGESRFKKIAQYYDGKANEHVILIEYRVRQRQNVDSQNDTGLAECRLLRDVNTLADRI
jgi:hypothetical protein